MKFKLNISDRKNIKLEKKELKRELKNVNKSILDLLPILDFDESNKYIKTSYGYLNLYQIESKDVFSLNSDEAEKHINDFANFLKYYQDDLKIICMQFPVNTSTQQENIMKKLDSINNPMYIYYLNKRLRELTFLEQHRYNKEYFIFIYADSINSIKEKDTLILRLSNDSLKISNIELSKKLKILYKLNNQNSKL